MRLWLTTVLALASGSSATRAQVFTVQSASPTTLGAIVAAPAGTSTLRVDPATGAVTNVAGAANRLTPGTARSLVTIACGNQAACDTANVRVAVTWTGTPTNRAGALQNFTVSTAGTSAAMVSPPGTGNAITFTLGPIGRGGSKTFWLGFDFPVAGDSSGAASGLSSSQFLVTASRTSGAAASSLAGLAQGTVFRGIAVNRQTNLAFGRISKPLAGPGSVTLSAAGVISLTGTGVKALASPLPSAATFAITGEGGQSVSLAVPAGFTMTGPSGSIAVTTLPDLAGAQTLGGALGGAGSLALAVGGTFTLSPATPAGAYSGSFQVTVNYN